MPERPFDIDGFLTDVKTSMDRYGRCVLAVSEGVSDNHNVPIAQKLAAKTEKDAHGNIQLGGGALADFLTKIVKDKLGYSRVRGDTFGYVQRSFVGCVSDVDQREAREAGEKAVQFAMSGDRDGSVTIHRTGSYSVGYQLSALEEIAAKTRKMPDAFIAASGTNVTDAFRLYLRPLLGKGMPDVHRLRCNAVPKVLSQS
jgi:6-phosphofructokinase 1